MDGFAERLATVEGRIEAACDRSGRQADDVTIVAVAKTVGPDAVTAASECGQIVIGENRVQEAMQKIPLCPGHLEWHMVGHLQRNKVGAAVGLFSMIHSVDSLSLLESLNEACGVAGITLPVCLQVNVSGEGSKFGMAPEEGPAMLDRCGGFMNLDVVGLMTIPPFTADPEDARPFFRKLREYRDAWRESSGFPLEHLSMGMSGDFEVAVEEGSTMVRLGASLFGTRTP